MQEFFLKSTKKGREFFRTCKLHILLAVKSRQNNYKTERVDIIGTISDGFAELKRQLRNFFSTFMSSASRMFTWIL